MTNRYRLHISRSTQFAYNRALLGEVARHLHPSSYHAFLLTCKAFAFAVIPHLYRTIPVKPNKPFPPLLQRHSTGVTNTVYFRQDLATLVTSLEVHNHDRASCPGRLHRNLPRLLNVHHLHLAEGSHLTDGKLCQPLTCPLIRRYDSQFTHLTIRKLQALPMFRNVTSLTAILRPCQLAYPIELEGKRSILPLMFRSLASVRSFDIVLWDERHKHRVDAIYDPNPAEWTGPQSAQRKALHWNRGCTYCRVPLLDREPIPSLINVFTAATSPETNGVMAPNVPKLLYELIYIAVWYTSITYIGMWNTEKSVRGMQGPGQEMTMSGFYQSMAVAFQKSLQMRVSAGFHFGPMDIPEPLQLALHLGTSSPLQDGQFNLRFATGYAWGCKVRHEGRISEMLGEESYWEDLSFLFMSCLT